MTILDSENTIYDNKIEEYFHEYFTNRGLDLEGDGYKRIENNLFHAAFEYVYRKMFKPPENERRKYGTSSIIDYDDAVLIDEIIDIYGHICKSYNIKGTQDMFCSLTGISRKTLNTWLNSSSRAYIYYDMDNNIIRDIQEYKLNNRGEYIKVPSTAHLDIAKKIKSFSHQTAYNSLNDFQNGQMMNANNAEEAGMEYNHKRQIEAVVAHKFSLEDMAGKIAELTQNQTVIEQIEPPKT
jgi:hypothetical protein